MSQFGAEYYRNNISKGLRVAINLQGDRTHSKLHNGTVEEVLTKTEFHPHGIMVKLEDGVIGRVARILDEKDQEIVTIPLDPRQQSIEIVSAGTIPGRIMHFLSSSSGSYCDDCLSDLLQIYPRQSINQSCRSLHSAGKIGRYHGRCTQCMRSKIVNGGTVSPIPKASRTTAIEIPEKKGAISFRELLDAGEDESVEFKSSALWSKGLTEDEIRSSQKRDIRLFGRDASKVIIAKTIAGFLNADGGHLVIGMKENKSQDADEIVGIEGEFRKLEDQCTDGYRRMLVDDVIHRYLEPRIFNHFSKHFAINFERIDGKTLCWIQVKPSGEPAFITINKREFFFIRTDAETRQIDGKDMVAYCNSRF